MWYQGLIEDDNSVQVTSDRDYLPGEEVGLMPFFSFLVPAWILIRKVLA